MSYGSRSNTVDTPVRLQPSGQRVWAAVILFVAATLAVPMAPSAQAVKKRPAPILSLNESGSFTLNVVDELPAYRDFALDIGDDVFAVDIRIEDAPADLDLLLYDQDDELVAYSELPVYNEHLRLSRISETPLQTGRYRLEVGYQYSRSPRVDGEALTTIPFQLSVDAVIPDVQDTLMPGESRTGRLLPESAMVDLYEITVPTGSPALRIDISDTDGDLDIFLNRGTPGIDPFRSDHWSQSVRSHESIVIDRTSIPSLRPGTYYAMVIDQVSDNYPADYRITVHDDETAPDSLHVDLTPPEPSTPLERALLSTVEILTFSGGGSGVIVSPEGLILTNYHVILDESGLPARDITVGMSLDHGRPPREMYTGRVVQTAVDRDLALIEITAGRYGEALPEGVKFPFLPGRFDAIPPIGSNLSFIGFPSIGGTGSRASVTFTRGTVAGYQDVPFGRLIKTDAEINEGSSGGAALDDQFRVIGFPTEVVGLDAGQLAYIYPITAIPESWRETIYGQRD
jgi:S1-C subfamily serine protease